MANYRLDRLLGRGGMAKVYYGWDLHLQRPAAIKVIDERFQDDPAFRDRFLREAQAMASWRHTHLPQIYQAGEENGIPYYAMEYIPGLDLARLLEIYSQRGELPPQAEVLRIGQAVAEALDYAHAHGVVHRDVKPANILVAQDGRIFLTDFGLVLNLAQGTQGEIFGSPHYIAPEQARSSALVVAQSDLYALGVVLFEMLTGSRPFDDDSPAAISWKQVNEPPPSPRAFNPRLNPAVEGVLFKALSKDPQSRYPTGRALLDNLERALRGDFVDGVFIPIETAPLPTSPIQFPEQNYPEHTGTQAPATESNVSLDELVNRQGPAAAAVQAIPQPATQRRRRGTAGCAIALAGLLALGLCLALLVRLPRWAGLAIGRTPTAGPLTGVVTSAAETPLATIQELPATGTPPPEATATPPPPIPSNAPQPVPPVENTTQLVLASYKDDSLFVINPGPYDIPLEPLQFGGGTGAVSGAEWGVDHLAPGQCVAAWKEEGKPRAPGGVICELVGNRLERKGKEKFWNGTFPVYYAGQPIGECNGKSGSCQVQLPSPNGG